MMIYINYSDLEKENYIGIKKKILAQCRAFESQFKTVYYTMYNGSRIYLMINNNVIEVEFAITNKQCNDILLKWIEKYNIEKAYIRYPLSDIWFIDFIRRLKERNIKSVLEFPTIPYDDEGWIRRPEEDKYYRNQLNKYVDCCTTYSNYKTVFNIPCISLVNGVDIHEHREKQYREKDGSIVLLAVATHVKWHGYERIIQGLHEYYSNGGQVNVIFNIVGTGTQLPYYQRITNELQLNEHIVFCGLLTGAKLDEIYDNSDIAIGSLGFYKIGLQSNAPIKLREYCARGIPFIYGYEDTSFNEENHFAYRVSNDATPVDIREIINFYEIMYNEKDFIRDMRKYTLLNFTWDKVLQPVVEYLVK